MARTFKSSERGSESDREPFIRSPGRETEGIGDPLGIVTGIPQGMVSDTVSDRFDSRQQRRSDVVDSIVSNIRLSIEEDLGIDNLGESIRGLNEIDLSQAEPEIEVMRIIAESARINATVNAARLQNDITVVSLLNEMLSAVEPAFGIATYGLNEIDQDAPQPVVPRSDEVDIPTKNVVVRAMPDNQDPIYIGDDQVEPEAGFILRPGEWRKFHIDIRDQELFMAAEQTQNRVSIIGLI